jgi:transcriptional regulator EpsA
MSCTSTLTSAELEQCLRLIRQGLGVRRHFDLLMWLQGDLQQFLPHDIMLSGWGDFRLGLIAHDIVSALPGVRTSRASVEAVSPLLSGLFNRWIEIGRAPFIARVGEEGFSLEAAGVDDELARAFRASRSALVHGICDARGRHDCLYVMFSRANVHDERARASIEWLLPYIDTALRQVPLLAAPREAVVEEPAVENGQESVLSDREHEIMTWVKMGKTNQEIGMILDISTFTVKNHLKRIFRKLAVFNRMQAVARFDSLIAHGAH